MCMRGVREHLYWVGPCTLCGWFLAGGLWVVGGGCWSECGAGPYLCVCFEIQ